MSGSIINQNRRAVVETTNNDVGNIMLYCGFSSRPNRKYIAEYGFELSKDIMSLTEKDIGNLYKGFSKRTAANGRIIFLLH